VSYCPGGERDHTVCGRIQATGQNHVSWRGEVARKLTRLAEVRSDRPDLLTGPGSGSVNREGAIQESI
jgi:hypothetical protein